MQRSRSSKPAADEAGLVRRIQVQLESLFKVKVTYHPGSTPGSGAFEFELPDEQEVERIMALLEKLE